MNPWEREYDTTPTESAGMRPWERNYAASNAKSLSLNDFMPKAQAPQEGYGLKRAANDLVGAGGAAAAAGGQGLSFGFADELQSALAAAVASTASPELTFKEAYGQAMNTFKQKRQQAAKDYPTAYYPSELAGALKTGDVVAEKIGGDALARVFATNPFKTSSAVGALSGGIYGAGTGDGGLEERLKSAGIAGGVGALVGPAASYVGSKIPAIASYIKGFGGESGGAADFAANRDLAQVVSDAENRVAIDKNSLRSESAAANKVSKAIKKDFPDDWESIMTSWKNGEAPLAETYGSRVGTLAKGAAQFPSGKAQADAYFNQAIAGAPEDIKSAIRQNVSGVENYHATADDILKQGQAKAAPLYERAFAKNQGINDPRINEFLAQPELQAGLQKGLKIQRLESVAEGKPFNPTDYSITGFNDAGDPIIGSVPNMRLLDAGKRGLDAMIQEQTDATTGKVTELGRALIGVKKSYVDKLKSVNSDYGAALDSAGDYFKVTNAMRNGKDFMNSDPELVQKSLSGMSEAEKNAYKSGVGKKLSDIIDSKNDGVNPYNAVFGSKQQQYRLSKILNPTEYLNLESSLRAQNKLYKMRNEVLGGSPTTSKLIAAADISGGAENITNSLASGGIKGAISDVANGVYKRFFSGLNDDTAAAVSRLLYETDPAKKVVMIDKMMGSKQLTEQEKQIVKEAYFHAESLLKPRIQGIIGANVTQENLKR